MVEYTLTLTEKQARVISTALEFYGRIHMGQLEEIAQLMPAGRSLALKEIFRDKLQELIPLFTGLGNPYAYFGIYSPEISDNARKAFDLHQVIRHRLAWDRNPEGDHLNVDFDPVSQTSRKDNLAKIEKVERITS